MKKWVLPLLLAGCQPGATPEQTPLAVPCRTQTHTKMATVSQGLSGSCGLQSVDRAAVSSNWCLGCHDGSIATPGFKSDGSHPYEIDYRLSWSQHQQYLAPIQSLPAEIVLAGGTTLTCGSCHDGDAPLPFRLAMPMDGSRLCLGCHPL